MARRDFPDGPPDVEAVVPPLDAVSPDEIAIGAAVEVLDEAVEEPEETTIGPAVLPCFECAED